MKKNLLIFVCLVVCSALSAQDLSGTWKGYFNAEGFGTTTRFRFVVEVVSKSKTCFEAVTYTSKDDFSAKASAQIKINKDGKTVIVRETKIKNEVKDKNQSSCLMECTLTLSTHEGLEIMSGSYKSILPASGMFCGGGDVYLEKMSKPR